MRKMFLLSISLCLAFSAMAQNVDEYSAAYANKRGVYLLPQAGDFALGVDATPFLRYMGNIFTSGTNVPPFFNGVNGFEQTIYGKYFLQDNRAIRARLSVNVLSSTDKGAVRNDVVFLDDGTTLINRFDSQSKSGAKIELGAGYEFRRGHGRVQGFWGGEVAIGFGSAKEKYEYGNRMNDENPTPSTFDFENKIYKPEAIRPIELKSGNAIFFGLGAFAGVEYFFAPQMSLGGEVGLGFRLETTGQGQVTSERWDPVDERVIEKGKSSYWPDKSMEFSSRAYGRICLMFHF